jgi:acyl transferase domain-containing protein
MTNEAASERYGVEPVALVGLACRVPGARNAEQFWANLAAGTESTRFYTREEQLKMGVAAALVDDPAFVPAAAGLDDIEYFDAEFFGMTSREADIADPQHRLFLELGHTALEDAGCDPARYPGAIGCYAGTGTNDYLWRNVRRNPRVAEAAGGLSVSIGNSPDYLATLASYRLNLRGPSFTVHTACSTSLVAIHLACEALRNGECDMALAGGVCIELPYGFGYLYLDGGITSPDGHCRPFDARAAGTIWGSGGGVVVLKRLPDALADGDHIRAVVLGNAINNDGSAKVGFSAPSAEGQADVVAQALGLAAIDPRTVTYVEAHGTATALGDPIEVSALSRAYSAGVTDRNWCGLGSVKSNFGHLSQAAGVVGVIKTVLALEQGLIPPSLHFESPNPAIDFAASPFYVNQALSVWDGGGGPRRAGVSSFGIGGTNAHVILEEAPRLAEPAGRSRPRQLLQVSARTETALATAVERLADHLTAHADLGLADVAGSLRHGRTRHPHRAVVVAADPADAAAALGDKRRRHTGKAANVPPRVAFLFSGQGSQYSGMGAELYKTEPAYAAAVDECAAALEFDIRELIMAGAEEQLRQTRYTQPALFVVEYALARLWESWGVSPAAMIGHSIGEYVAATLAGVFTLPDALRVVAARGALMQAMPTGAMLAVQASEDEVRGQLPEGLAIATVNGPGTCVVAGPSEDVDRFAQSLRGRRTGSRPLRTSHAFHSPMMDPVLADFQAVVAGVARRAPTRAFLSNRTGDWITAEQATDPAYWAGHLRETVRFGDCVRRLLDSGTWLMVECGPGRQLVGLARMQLPAGGPVPLPSLPGTGEKQRDLDVLYDTAGRLWVAGVDLVDFGDRGRRVPLPTYPYERSYHWLEPEVGHEPEPDQRSGPRPMAQWCSVPVWRRLPAASEPTPPARCLLFATGAEGAALAAHLTSAGTEVIRVAPAEASGRDADGGYTVRPAERDDYTSLLAGLAAGDGVPPRLVHAWCLSPSATLEHGFFSLVALGQALASADLAAPVSVDVVTAGTHDVLGADVTRPEHATVGGPVRVLPLELPEKVSVRHVDADPALGPEQVGAAVAAEIGVLPKGEQGETVALRAGRRWAPAYDEVPLPTGGPGLRPGGVYLITGGVGGIGISIARDLAATVRARLVLVSRTADRADRATEAIRAIEAAGGEVLVLTGDVTSAADLRRIRAETLARFGRLDGIVHAAGVPGGGLIEAKSRAAAEAVLAPKVAGTLALAEVFGDMELDFVALCSSVTGVVGGFGQVDYCAASAFLDAYAHSGLGFHCRVLAIDWAGWLGVGMAAETSRPEALMAAVEAADRSSAGTAVDHPILTVRHASGQGQWCGGVIGPGTHWVLAEHRIAGVPVMPGTGHLEIARAAVAAATPRPGPDAVVELRDVAFIKPMSVPDESVAELRVLLTPTENGVEFQVTSDGEVHVRGSGAWVVPGPAAVHDVAALQARCGPADEVGPALSQSRSGLLTFGPRWTSLRRIHSDGDEALARLEAPDVVAGELDRWVLHPAVLDEATSFAAGNDEGAYLPLGYGRITIRGPLPARLWSYVRRLDSGEVETSDIVLLDDDGRVVVDIGEFMMRRIDRDAVATSVSGRAPTTPVAASAEPVGIRPAEGAEVFRRLLAADLGPQVVVTIRGMAAQFARVRAVTMTTVSGQMAQGHSGSSAGRRGDADYTAPRGDIEAALAAVWGDVLGVADVGRDDDFIALGGNSLVAVQLIAQIRKAVNVKLPLRSLFEASTVAGMAELVEQLRAQEASGPATPAAPAVTVPRLPRPE